jgi:ribose transport system substrate-binding protein
VSSAIRPVVWIAVIVAAVAVGWYVKTAPNPNPEVAKSAAPANYLFLAGGSDPYWQLCIAGAKASAAERGANVDVRTPDGEGEEGLKEQLEWLTAMQPDKFDGLAIGPIDPVRQTTLINAAAEKLPVVTVDSDAPQSRRMFYIGSSNLEAGMIAGKMVKAALPDGGKVAVLMASEAKTNAAERKQGLQEALSRSSDEADAKEAPGKPAYTIVGFYLDQGNLDTCRQNVLRACKENQDLGAVVGTFGYHGPIILDALKDVERAKDIHVVAFDEDERTLAGIDDGRVYATIVQDPFMFGAEAVEMLEKVRNGRFLSLPVGNGAVGVHCRAVTKNNIDEFRKQLSKRLAAIEPEKQAAGL